MYRTCHDHRLGKAHGQPSAAIVERVAYLFATNYRYTFYQQPPFWRRASLFVLPQELHDVCPKRNRDCNAFRRHACVGALLAIKAWLLPYIQAASLLLAPDWTSREPPTRSLIKLKTASVWLTANPTIRSCSSSQVRQVPIALGLPA